MKRRYTTGRRTLGTGTLLTMTGSDAANGHDNVDGSATWSETWAASTGWSLDSGSGDATYDTLDAYSYNGGDPYTRGTVSGTFTQSGDSSLSWIYKETYTATGGVWVTTGKGDGEDKGGDVLSWSGSGTYSSAFDGTGTLSGVYNESGSQGTSYDDTLGVDVAANGVATYRGTGMDRVFYTDVGYDFNANGTAAWDNSSSDGTDEGDNFAYSQTSDAGGSTLSESGGKTSSYEYKNLYTQRADGTWYKSSTSITDSGSGSGGSSYVYNDTLSSGSGYGTTYYDPQTNEVEYTQGHEGSDTQTTADSVDQSSGYSYSRQVTYTYADGSPFVPTSTTGSGSGTSSTHEETQHSMTEDSSGTNWYPDESGTETTSVHNVETWSGGSDTTSDWQQTYGDSSDPIVTNTSTPTGSGTITSVKTFTSGGDTTTIWDESFPLTEYTGRRGPALTYSIGADAGPGEPGEQTERPSDNVFCDEHGNPDPIQFVSDGAGDGGQDTGATVGGRAKDGQHVLDQFETAADTAENVAKQYGDHALEKLAKKTGAVAGKASTALDVFGVVVKTMDADPGDKTKTALKEIANVVAGKVAGLAAGSILGSTGVGGFFSPAAAYAANAWVSENFCDIPDDVVEATGKAITDANNNNDERIMSQSGYGPGDDCPAARQGRQTEMNIDAEQNDPDNPLWFGVQR